MPIYNYSARNITGKTIRASIAADSKSAAVMILRRQRLNIISIKEKGKEIAVPTLRPGKVSLKELAIFTRQLSVMIDAGLPLVQCMEILATQQENKAFQSIIGQVREKVEGGATLTEAMRGHPRVFNNLYTSLVHAGEVGGILDTILQRLAIYLEKTIKLRRAVRSASIYPLSVISIAVLVVTVILWKVIPTFAALFASLGAQLPLPTRIVVWLSNFIANFFIYIVIAIGLIIWSVRWYYRTPKGRRVIDGLVLKFPVLGTVFLKIAIARFCRTLGTLTSSGVPILDGLRITASTSGNAVVEEAILETRRQLEEGKTLADPLEKTGIFPGMVTQMIRVGETTGELDLMLGKIADFYEDEVDEAVENLMALLEPFMILFLGITIGGIVISMYLPMFELISKIP